MLANIAAVMGCAIVLGLVFVYGAFCILRWMGYGDSE